MSLADDREKYIKYRADLYAEIDRVNRKLREINEQIRRSLRS